MTAASKDILLPVTGMSCAACASSVESMLASTAGVENARVNFASGMVDIRYDELSTNLEKLRTSIQSIGYDLIIEEEEEKKQEALAEHSKSAYRSLLKRTIGSLLFTLPIMIISMGFPDLAYGNFIMLLLTIPVIFWSGRGFYSRAVLQLLHKMATMDTLVSLSTAIAFLYSLFLTIWPEWATEFNFSGHVYYEAAAVIISFVLLGKLLEERAKAKTSSAIKNLMKLQPEVVEVLDEDGSIQIMKIESVSPGMSILVKPGEQVPIDGVVISGDSTIDESMISGESMPVQKTANSEVYAGTLNQQGKLIIKATAVGSETLLAKIIKMVQKAQGSKAEVQKLVDKIAGIFVPVVIGIAVLTFLSWLVLGGEHRLSYALVTSISVLVIACPCALGLATPTAIMVGLGRGAENNILVKDVSALEELNKVDTLVFDKTGTLTEGKPEVASLEWHNRQLDNNEREYYSKLIFALESYSDHPLSQAITQHLASHAVNIDFSAFENIPGKGIKAIHDNRTLLIGSANLLEENQLKLPDNMVSKLGTYVYFAVDNVLIATITLTDKIRSNTREVIESLHQKGYNTWLLTGDNEHTAKVISEASGIENYSANLLPHDKAEFIKHLKSQDLVVAMIGDGINDSEALATADVGIAMGSGSDIAMDVAMMTLKTDNLALVEKAIALSEKTTRTIKQNLFWAFIYNMIGIPVAAGVLYSFNGFLLNPMVAAGAMALSSVSVVTNSLLLKRRRLQISKRINSKTSNKEMTTYKFKTNINCGGCIASVTPKLEDVDGIRTWHVDTDNPSKILTVELDNSKPESITKAVEEAGFSIEQL